MQNNDIIAISDSVEYALFRLAGINTVLVQNKNEVSKLLNRYAKEYKIIIISDILAEEFKTQIKKYDEETYPIILSLPTSKGNLGTGIKNIVEKAKESLGIDVFKE